MLFVQLAFDRLFAVRRAPLALALAGAVWALAGVGCMGHIDGSAEATGASGSGGMSRGSGSSGSSGGTRSSGSSGTTGGGNGPGATATGGSAGGGTSGGLAMPPPTGLAAANACASAPASVPGPRKLRRLTQPELEASIRSIFGDTAASVPVATVFADPVALGFSIDADALLVQGLNASQLADNADAVATWALEHDKLSAFASCTTLDPKCGTALVKAFGRRAFRTTLTDSDPRVATYTNLFMSGSSFSEGAQAVIAAMLQSPYFLYRTELGTKSGEQFKLTPFEVATELAYLLTGTTPSDTLLDAADAVASGGMTVAAMVDGQAAGMIAAGGPGSASAVMGFMNGWLGLPRLYTTAKDASVFVLEKAIQDAMAMEAQSLILEAFNGNRRFGDVLTADHSFLNKDLAAFYGINNATNLGSTFVSVPYAGTGRDPGLLSTGALLNGYARPDTDSPTQRGHMVRSRLLCQEIPAPPANLDTTFKISNKSETTRDHFINSHGIGACSACHKMMDWTGFAFESYDGFGRYRTTDKGMPVVNSATIYGDPQGHDVMVTGLSGPGSLSEYLSRSDDVNRCMMRYWSYYAYGSSSWAQDGCTYDAIYTEAQTKNFGLKSVLMALVHAPTFTTRLQDQ